MKLLMVSVGGGRFAVAADAVVQILDPALDHDVRSEAESGEVVWRGQRHRVAEWPEVPGRSSGGRASLYLVLRHRLRGCALPVDSAETIQEVPAAAIAPLPAFIFSGGRRLFRGIFFDGREPRLLLDVGAIA